MTSLFHLSVVGIIFYSCVHYFKQRRLARLLPPGPLGDPFIGHIRILPSENQGQVYHEWSQKYGDVMHLKVLNQHIIVLNSVKAATELLGKRGSIYSDRPSFVVFELLGWSDDFAFFSYGERYRKHKKLFHAFFNSESCRQLQPIQLEYARLLVKDLMKNEGNHDALVARFATLLQMRVAYGPRIVSDNDEILSLVDRLVDVYKQTGPPGGTALDLFPLLRYFPSWFPGTHYANIARKWSWVIRGLHDIPFERARRQSADGTAEPSFVSQTLGQLDTKSSSYDIGDVKAVAAVIYAAGADSTWACLATFFLAMVLNPSVQKKGQEEIDRIVGRDRLPDFGDYEGLIYIRCILQEVLRRHPVTPLGIPHRSTMDDTYEGMFIPKGSIIIGNTAGISLDESTYLTPRKFNPDRFLPRSEGGDEEPPLSAAFGFGRRLWIVIATSIASLDISKVEDKDGVEIATSPEFVSGIIRHPRPFQLNISRRLKRSAEFV
ncbi:hypothetical protein ONZ45_g662 [Pleurotus djamor]|nr:hypothetical protein ONZ45_g662 [Pleurotus djamor]